MSRSGAGTFIRGWIEEDLAVYERWLAPGALWQTLDAPYDPPISVHEIQAALVQCRGWIAGPLVQRPPRMVVAGPDGGLIGTVNRYGRDREARSTFIGIGLYDPSWWGRGVGTLMLREWMDIIREDFPDLQEFRLATWSGNRGMCRIAEKLGFSVVERLAGAYVEEGTACDRLTCSLPVEPVRGLS